MNQFGFIIAFSMMLSLNLFSDAVTPELLIQETNKPTIINYGYNKFLPSPFSQKIAVVPFDSEEGMQTFAQSQHKKAFFKLAPHYAPQQTITNCGISSGVIILNTIYADAKKTPPISITGSHFDKSKNTISGQFIWTETNFYTPQIQRKLDQNVVEGKKQINNCYVLGVSLDQLADSLKLQGLTVEAFHVSDVNAEDIQKFRSLIKAITANPTHYMIAHYQLDLYLGDNGGHYSPIAAYDEKSDSILILDTWAAANTWIWVKLEDLYKSMNTLDGKTYRGYLLINNTPAINVD